VTVDRDDLDRHAVDPLRAAPSLGLLTTACR
jgi:hypothetical protein